MRIVFDDPLIGKFSWELPESLAEKYRDDSRMMREDLGLEEELVTAADVAEVETLQNMIAAFLQLLILARAAPEPSSHQVTCLVGDGLSSMMHTACQVIPDDDPENEE